MKTGLENQREAQEAATRARAAFKKKMNRLSYIVPFFIMVLGLITWWFMYT